MAYYIRVLAEKTDNVPVSSIESWLKSCVISKINVVVESGTHDSWEQITLVRDQGDELFTVERNLVIPDSLGQEEIDEFVSELENAKPVPSAKWLIKYLPTIRVIYAFQVLFHSDNQEDWEVLSTVHTGIWRTLGGILQADGEGFSNREGYHIIWQFSDHVSGSWNMAVLEENGIWKSFEMDLANREHRRAFLDGQVPVGVVAKQTL